jgi:hypothetical protein
MDPAEPAILLLDNAWSLLLDDLQEMQWLRARDIHVVTLPPHLTHIMQPVDVCWARALKTEYGRCLRKWLAPEALARASAMLPPAASQGRSAARDSRVVIAFASAEVEREMEAKNPARVHTGSRVPTTLDFLARLAIIEAEKEIREAQDQVFARDRVERILGRALPWTHAPVA